MTPLRIGLIGYGPAARVFHGPLIAACPGVELAAAAVRNPEAVTDAPPGLPIVTIDALLADPSVEAVVVATPSGSHHEVARRALEAGKHVVVDKPVTVTAAEADDLIALAAKRRRVLTVFHNRRWDGDFLALRALIAEGRLGRVLSFESNYDRFRPTVRARWREQAVPGSGLHYDLGSHLIDQALVLFGRPDFVRAELRAIRPGAEAVDDAIFTLGFGPTRALLRCRILVAEPGSRLVVQGDRATFRKLEIDPQEDHLRAGTVQTAPETGWLTLGREAGVPETQRLAIAPGHYGAFYAGFVAAVRDGAPPPVDPRDGRDVVRVIEAAIESSATGRDVRLEW
ncbi:Gfo/Idh/MocA family oxidoreductase [Inquilinus sp. YAF38]|uniref:Gfo/Idh/MocA family oxidoreductase n=1 Tax=Inquilinus sp. YAF38 TaxID=3233084 RepID=UPI003F91D494